MTVGMGRALVVRKAAGAGVLSLTILSGSVGGCDAAEDTVGPRGGVVVSEDGRFVLDIPAGALDREIEIAVRQMQCQDMGPIGTCYEVQPIGTAFLRPAVVELELGGMDLDMDPRKLGFVAARDTGWSVLSDRDVDMQDEVVSASALYLSEFAVVPVE